LAVVLVTASVFVIKGILNDDSKKEPIDKVEEKVEKEEVIKKQKISFKFSEDVLEIPDSNDAKNVIIIDKTSKRVIAQRNAEERAYPASTTKIMTLLVAAENITDWEKEFTMTLEITDPLFREWATVAGFLNGEVITMRDLAYGMILPSGADGAVGIAISVAGSEQAFVELMNKKVEELELKNTHFTNVSGLHNEQNYSTAYDMAVILEAALQNDFCKQVLSTYQYRTTVTNQHPEGILLSSTLFSYMYGTEPETSTILGGKTGYVNESGYCIASFGKSNANDNEYIIVTLGNSSLWPAFFGQIDLYKQFAK